MKEIILVLLAAVSVQALAVSFKVGPIKVTSHKADKVITAVKNAGDDVKDIAKGTGKWANTELITTIKGERHLVIKPYIAISHKGDKFKVGPNEAYIKVAGITLKTHNFAKRLAQIGCIAGTEGAATAICGTDLLHDLLDKEVGPLGIPADAVGGQPPVITNNTESNFCKAEPNYSSCFLTSKRPIGGVCGCFNDQGDIVLGTVEAGMIKHAGGMTEVQMVPPSPKNPGFDFSHK